MKLVIMAGGTGTRLWPLSRRTSPKQSQPIIDNDTMVQKTFRRLRRHWSARNIFVSTNTAQYDRLRKELPSLPQSHFFCEPLRRDTAAAMGYAAMRLHHINAREIMCTVHSDHFVRDAEGYCRMLKRAGQVVQRNPDQTVLVGTRPTFPDTGKGYVKVSRKVGKISGSAIYTVERFIEKPKLEHAKKFYLDWHYLLNTGWFTYRVDAMLSKYRKWLPRTFAGLMRIQSALDGANEMRITRRVFERLPKIAIEFGIMEKDRNMLCLPAEVEWIDIGDWHSVYQMMATRNGENVVRGKHIVHDSSGNLLFSYTGRLIAVTGLRDMVVVDTGDAVMVCPRDRVQNVRQLVAELEKRKLDKHL